MAFSSGSSEGEMIMRLLSRSSVSECTRICLKVPKLTKISWGSIFADAQNEGLQGSHVLYFSYLVCPPRQKHGPGESMKPVCFFCRTKTQPEMRGWQRCNLNFNNCKSVWPVTFSSHRFVMCCQCRGCKRNHYTLCLQVEMDARNAEFQQQLQERDAEINRLWRELRVRHWTNK